MGQSLANLLTHIIFSTKNREMLLDPEVAPRMHAYLGGIARHNKCVPIEIGGVSDHVHLLIAVHPTVAVAELVRLLKANSSKWMHEEVGRPAFAWQTGYGAFSVSESNCDTVREYIRNQAEHHRTRTFQEELIAFLERHGVAYDLQYIWA